MQFVLLIAVAMSGYNISGLYFGPGTEYAASVMRITDRDGRIEGKMMRITGDPSSHRLARDTIAVSGFRRGNVLHLTIGALRCTGDTAKDEFGIGLRMTCHVRRTTVPLEFVSTTEYEVLKRLRDIKDDIKRAVRP